MKKVRDGSLVSIQLKFSNKIYNTPSSLSYFVRNNKDDGIV